MDNSSSKGMGIIGVLQIIFIVLKLIGVISWSWWLVLIPLWIDIACFVIGIIIVLVSNRWW